MTKTSIVTGERDDANMRVIHGYFQTRVVFRLFYPGDGPNSFERNRRLYEVAVGASPEDRAVLAEQLQRRVVKQIALFGAALLLLRLVL